VEYGGFKSLNRTTTIGGRRDMGMLPVHKVEVAHLARLCADQLALKWILQVVQQGMLLKSK
jgi:hypothetical protein